MIFSKSVLCALLCFVLLISLILVVRHKRKRKVKLAKQLVLDRLDTSNIPMGDLVSCFRIGQEAHANGVDYWRGNTLVPETVKWSQGWLYANSSSDENSPMYYISMEDKIPVGMWVSKEFRMNEILAGKDPVKLKSIRYKEKQWIY